MATITDYVVRKFGSIIGSLSESILRILLGLIIFFIGFIIGKIAGRAVYKMLNEAEINKFLKESGGIKINADHLISTILSYFIYFISLLLALEQIGVANFVIYILSAAIVLIVAVSFFLTLKDLIPNFIAGLYLYNKEGMKEGSLLEINDISGKLVHVDLFHLRIKTAKGDLIYIPNSYAINNKIKVKKS